MQVLCKSFENPTKCMQILFKSYANPVPMLCKYNAKRIANGSASYANPMQAYANAIQILCKS